MIRATTATHVFIFETDPDTFAEIQISYAQKGRVVLVKAKSDLTFGTESGAYTATLKLTQEETRLFRADIPEVNVQVRALSSSGGDAFASQIETVPLYDVLNDRVLR